MRDEHGGGDNRRTQIAHLKFIKEVEEGGEMLEEVSNWTKVGQGHRTLPLPPPFQCHIAEFRRHVGK